MNPKYTFPEFVSTLTKQWLQVKVGDEIVIHFLHVIFHIQSRFQAVVCAY